jgi:MOSC domain-containing protein YiiM
MPHIEAIFITGAAGEPMRSVAEAEAMVSVGLATDRYATGRGYYSRLGGVCQFTLIEAEALERMQALHGVKVCDGEHRRNIVTRGIALAELIDRRFRLGEVLVEYGGPRPPCAYLGRLVSPGLPRAMGEGAGICAYIVGGGILRVGDPIVLTGEASSRTRPKLP